MNEKIFFKMTPKLAKRMQSLTSCQKDVYIALCFGIVRKNCVSQAVHVDTLLDRCGLEDKSHLHRIIRQLKSKGAIRKCKNQKKGVHKYIMCLNTKETNR